MRALRATARCTEGGAMDRKWETAEPDEDDGNDRGGDHRDTAGRGAIPPRLEGTGDRRDVGGQHCVRRG